MEKKKTFIISAIAVLFPLTVILVNIQILGFDLPWQQRQFAKQGSYAQLGAERVRAQAENLKEYLRGRQELGAYYSERESKHLADVKSVLDSALILTIALVIIFVLLVIFMLSQQGMIGSMKIFFSANLIALAVYGISILFVACGFDRIFFAFHQLAFNNDFWLLDPSSESLIVIFPPEFFLALSERILLYCLAEIGVLAALLSCLDRRLAKPGNDGA